MVYCDLKFRISLTEAGLAKGMSFLRNIPPPDSPIYNDHSAKVGKGQGGQARHGFATATVLWDALSPDQSYELRTLVQNALDGLGVIYLTIDRSNGTSPGPDWIDVYGVPYMPDIAPGRTRGKRRGVIHNSIQLFVNDLTIVNDPAVF